MVNIFIGLENLLIVFTVGIPGTQSHKLQMFVMCQLVV
jgi:hypothetical protein